MSLISRIQAAITRALSGPTPLSRPPATPFPPVAPPLRTSLGWSQAVFDQYVPDEDRGDQQLRNLYAQGFDGYDRSRTAQRARTEFQQYLRDHGINVDEFWADWRDGYESLHQ